MAINNSKIQILPPSSFLPLPALSNNNHLF
jgi:hypothetical protein